MTTSILGAITLIAITAIMCITVNICNKREHTKDVYYIVNNRLKDLIDDIERIKSNNLKLDINILLANLKDIKRL